MVKGIELANELRKLADAVEQLEEVVTYVDPTIYFGFSYGYEQHKQGFIDFAKVMPKPFDKVYDGTELKLKYTAGGLNIQAYIERDKVCTLITPAQPAVYDCTPILSKAEEAQLGITEPESIDDIPF